MNKKQNVQSEIFQILSNCLRCLKRKIIIFIKIYLRQSNCSSLQEIQKQLIKEIYQSKKRAQLLKSQQFSLIEDAFLFQRFVGRVKEIIRMYLVHASISQDIYTYLKKIKNFNFRQKVDFQAYVIFLFEETPQFIKGKIIKQQILIQKQFVQLKLIDKEMNDFKLQQDSKKFNTRFLKSEIKLEANSFNDQFNLNSKSTKGRYQIKKQQVVQEKRPIDVLQTSVKNFDCFDCDISQYRTAFFQLLQNNENATLQIQNSMTNNNRYVKETIFQYCKSYNRYKSKILKNPNYQAKQYIQRCMTAGNTHRQLNFSSLSGRNNNTSNKLKNIRFIQRNKKYQTIGFDIDQQQKKELEKQIMNRRNNVLKMKNISIIGEDGHLQLSAQKSHKHHRLTYRQNNNTNLKKKYEMFLKRQKHDQSQFKIQGTLKTIQHYNPYKAQKAIHNSFFQTINPQITPKSRKIK